MAKAKTNLSAAIREALGANPNKSPSEIAELLKEQGVKTDAQYVSNIKSLMKSKGKGKLGRRKTAKKMAGRRIVGGNEVGSGFAGVPAALAFIREAGSLEKAKIALAQLEEIGKAVQ